MKSKYNHKSLFIFIALILLAICTFMGCLFLYFKGNDSAEKNATVMISYANQSSELTVDSSMPVTDAIGKQLEYTPNQTKYGYSEFSLTSNMQGVDSVNYEIYAVPLGVAVELPTEYVRMYLTDGDNDLPIVGYQEEIPSYRDLKVADSNLNGKQLYSGTLEKGETKNFTLRMWLDEMYPITPEMRSFKIALFVKVIDQEEL